MKPSILYSTLSMMAVCSLLTIIFCIVMGIEIKSELLAVLTSVIGAYTGARTPNTPQYEKDQKGQRGEQNQHKD